MNEALILYIFLGLMVFNLMATILYAVGMNQLRLAVRRAIKAQFNNGFQKPR